MMSRVVARSDALRQAVEAQARRPTPGVADMADYLPRQSRDRSHRRVLGPLCPGGAPSGVVRHRGETVATWGDVDRPEMAFSVTKSILSLVAGLAADDGRLELDRAVGAVLEIAEFAGTPRRRAITWRHLLTQTSGWNGRLWGTPTSADAQSRAVRGRPARGPGSGWAYNDVRVNLLALALTRLHRRPLPEVLTERIAAPLGLSGRWSWSGYDGATTRVNGHDLPVVSGGAHWGGGLVMSAADLARVGELYLRRGRVGSAQVLGEDWITRTCTPTAVHPDYGLLWWLNGRRRVFPRAPATGYAARGNLGRHLLWVDPARDLVVTSHWGEDVGRLLAEVSDAVDVQCRG